MKTIYVLLLLLFVLLSNEFWSQINVNNPKFSNFEIKKELNQIQLNALDSGFENTQKVDNGSASEENDNNPSTADILGILGFIISLLAFIYSYLSFQKEKANKHFELLFDIDKLLIDKPYLWEIYDKYKGIYTSSSPTAINQGWLDGQLEAFCYLHLNNFEFVFRYPPSNRTSKKTWRNYMIDLIVSSTRFKKILTKESKGYIYNKNYRKNMLKYLKLSQKIEPIYDEYIANTITIEEYYRRVHEKLNEAIK